MQRKEVTSGIDLVAENVKCFFPCSPFLQTLLTTAVCAVLLCKSCGHPGPARLQPSPRASRVGFAAVASASGRRVCLLSEPACVVSEFEFQAVQMSLPFLFPSLMSYGAALVARALETKHQLLFSSCPTLDAACGCLGGSPRGSCPPQPPCAALQPCSSSPVPPMPGWL